MVVEEILQNTDAKASKVGEKEIEATRASEPSRANEGSAAQQK